MSKQRSAIRSCGCATLVIGLVVGQSACSADEPRATRLRPSETQILPMALPGMPLRTITTGKYAEKLIAGIHGKSVAALASYVGRYRGVGSTATLYISRLPRVEDADSLIHWMSERIGEGDRNRDHHACFGVDSLEIHAVLTQGREHFFYSRGTSLWWLGIDRRMARVGLADLLRMEPDRLPEGVIVDGIDLLPPADSLYRR